MNNIPIFLLLGVIGILLIQYGIIASRWRLICDLLHLGPGPVKRDDVLREISRLQDRDAQHKSRGRPRICLDMDGVISSWDHGSFYTPGPMIDDAPWFLEALSKIGDVVLTTCRTNPDLYPGHTATELAADIWWWLDDNGLLDYVSEVYAGPGKPFAAAYVDDKGVRCDPESEIDAYGFARTLEHVRALCNNGKQHPQKNAPPEIDTTTLESANGQ